MINIKRYIITGCNGYLGGECCKSLHNAGYEVVGVSRNNNGINDLLNLGIHCATYKMLTGLLKSSDCIIHCAGKTGFGGQWEEFNAINVEWTLELFKLAVEKKVCCFVYISSVAAMGYSNCRSEKKLTEEAMPILHPYEFYGRSKLLAENHLKKEVESSETRLVVLRPGLIYGKRNIVINKNRLKPDIIVDPESVVPFVYIDNFIDAIILTSQGKEKAVTYLVVDDEQPTMGEIISLKKKLGLIMYKPYVLGKFLFVLQQKIKCVVKILLKKSSAPIAKSTEPLVLFHTRKLRYDCSLIKQNTGWKPKVSLQDGWRMVKNESA